VVSLTFWAREIKLRQVSTVKKVSRFIFNLFT
jgi:hypothetical protein